MSGNLKKIPIIFLLVWIDYRDKIVEIPHTARLFLKKQSGFIN
jgi:hypothetical protein